MSDNIDKASAMNKFNIGDTVYKGIYERVEKYVVCPDCGGTKHVKVVLHDETEIIIECGGCDPGGYVGSTGRIKQYEYQTTVASLAVTGFSIDPSGVEYRLCGFMHNNFSNGWCVKESELSKNEEEARQVAEEKRLEREQEENKRLMAKTKDHRSWAWNATYHRKCAKQAQRDLEYHQQKAVICASKKKEAQ